MASTDCLGVGERHPAQLATACSAQGVCRSRAVLAKLAQSAGRKLAVRNETTGMPRASDKKCV
jgi:hypothetical protein